MVRIGAVVSRVCLITLVEQIAYSVSATRYGKFKTFSSKTFSKYPELSLQYVDGGCSLESLMEDAVWNR
jgi:uncharacterized protein YqhQ